jgi:hypothetical protein
MLPDFHLTSPRNDILRKHGVIPQKPPSPTPMIEEAIVQARQLAHDNRLEGKNLDELDALEDEEDDDFLESYRQKRFAELTSITQASVYNQVYAVQKPDYARDVTEESNRAFIFVLLTSSLGTNTESALLTQMWRELAKRFGDVKFCQMRADLCIEGYPEKNTPTVLIYRNGEIKKQLVTLMELKGKQTRVQDVEQVLVDVGAVKMKDTRLSKNQREDEDAVVKTGIRSGNKTATVDDDDSDWD